MHETAPFGTTGPALPRGPRMPAPLQTLNWLLRPYPFLKGCAARFGEPFTLRISGWGTLMLLSEPASIRQLLTADPNRVLTGEANEFMRPLLGRHSLLLTDGRHHLFSRRLILPALQAGGSATYANLVRESTERLIREWEPGSRVNIHAAMRQLSLRVIMRTILGTTEDEKIARAGRALSTVLGTVSALVAFVRPLQRDLGPASPGGWFRARVDALDRLIYEEIRRCRSGERALGVDLLSVLIQARDGDGAPFSDAEVRDQVVTLLVAGHDTPATALAWAFHWIHTVPGIHERVMTEIESVPPGEAEAFLPLPYLEATCQETLRIVPIVEVISRVTHEPFELAGYSVPPGVLISPCSYLLHRHPELYPDGEQFRPERFLERRFASHEFIPFGGGAHRCLGAAVALSQMKVVLGVILGRFRLEPDLKDGVRPVRRNVTIAPAGGTPMIVRERRPPPATSATNGR